MFLTVIFRNDKITVNDSNYLSPSNTRKFTISFWVKFNRTSFKGEGSQKDYINFLGKGSSNNHEYTFRYYNSTSRTPNRISFSLYSLTGGTGTTGGNNGGTGSGGSGGGGGGAGAVGANAGASGGNGGAGVSNSITG